MTELGGSPEQNEEIAELIAKIKSAANPNHAYQLTIPQSTPQSGVEASDIPLDSTPAEVFDELVRMYGAGVVDSVTGERGGPYTVTFNVARGNVQAITGKSETGLTVQTRTQTEGAVGTSEVQVLTFVSTGQMVAAITALSNRVTELKTSPTTIAGIVAFADATKALNEMIGSRTTIGKIIGDAIKSKLNLPDNAFTLTIDFVDASSTQVGFQAAARVFLNINKTITKTLGFDLDVPDLGPVTVTTGGNVDFTVTGNLDLDFGFRFDTFTPYLFKTTNLSLSTSINSAVNVTAGVGGIQGGLTGNLQLRGSTVTPIGNGLTQFKLPAIPQDNLVIVTRNNVVLKRGNALTDVGVDYIVDKTTSPITLRFKTATTAGTKVEYATATSPANASIGILIDPALVPSDQNTIGGIPFSQLFSSAIPAANKFDFTMNGMAFASLDANLLGVNVDDALTVVVGLNTPKNVDFRADGIKNFVSNLSDIGSMNLSQLISGARSMIAVIENGMKKDLLEKMPLVGDGVNLDNSFVGKLKKMVDDLEALINTATSSVDALKFQIQSAIFNALGPAGAKILKLNPLFHDDPNVPNNVEIGDARDVEVTISDLLNTAPADLEFTINLQIAGRDKIDANFDLGLDAFAFELTTSGGVELDWSYNFNFGFGVNLQRGFFFQLNPNVTYTGGLPTAGTPEIGLAVDVRLKPGTTLKGDLFFLSLSATSNPIEDYNRDGIINDGTSGVGRGPKLNEVVDQFDYNRDGDIADLLSEADSDGNGRLSKGTGLSGMIFVDIANPDNDPNNRLTFSELRQTAARDLFNAGITTEVYADLRLAAEVAKDLPNISADLTLDWAIGLTSRDGLIGGGIPDVAIRDVKLDMGSFLTTVIGPVLESFNTYAGPLRPLIDFLAMPIPGLNDLSKKIGGPEMTFLTLGIIGSNPTEQTIAIAKKAQQVIGLLQEIYKFADTFQELTADGNNIIINFGTYYLTGKPLPVTNASTTGSGLERLLPSNSRAGTPVRVFSNGAELPRTSYKFVRFKDGTVSKTKLVFTTAPTGTITATYTTTEGGTTDLTNKNTPVQVKPTALETTIPTSTTGAPSPNILNQPTNASATGLSKTKSLLGRLGGQPDANGKGGLGIKIPLLADPSNIFKLFTGEKADIIQWDIPKLELNVPFKKKFGPIPIPPVPLFATINANLNAFADLSIGFDTRGIAKTGNFFDGFYFGDLANVTKGADIDEFGLSFEVAVGATIDLALVSAGIEGGIRANIGLNWNDLDGDGKIYLDELADLFKLNPTPSSGDEIPGLCVFDAHGSITAFIRAYYDIFGLGGDTVPIADFQLFNFNHHCTAPGLAELTSGRSDFADGTLLLYAGDYAGPRGEFFGSDINEEFTIAQTEEAGGALTTVTFAGKNRDNEPEPVVRTYKGVQQIFFSGGSGNDKITIDSSVTVPVRLFGGDGDDVLIGGSGSDILAGGNGNDTLRGGLGSDRYVFSSNWGIDSVEDAASLVDLNDTFDFSAVTTGLAISGGSVLVTSGTNRVQAGPSTAAPSTPVPGIERVIGGSSIDTLTVSTIIASATANVWSMAGKNQGKINNLFAFEGIENIVGGAHEDRFFFDSTDTLTGTVDGAGGSDTLDYSSYVATTPVTVDRQAQTANGLGRFQNMEFIRGGQSQLDTIIGRNVNAAWTIDGINAGKVLDAGSSTELKFDRFENITGGNLNDQFEVLVGGKLNGKLLGTSTPGQSDSDTVRFTAYTTTLQVNVAQRNQGVVSSAGITLVDFSSIEGVTTGSGNDTFVMAPLSSLTGTTDGGVGARDTIDFSAWSSSISVNLLTGVNQVGSIAGVEDIVGGSSSDLLLGNNVDNRLMGMGGADDLQGFGGNDLLIGDSAVISQTNGVADSIRLTDDFAGNDRLTDGNGNNILLGGLGADTINSTGTGNNWIAGDMVLVLLNGNLVTAMQGLNSSADGNDTISAGAGNDSIIAGNGSDILNDVGGRNLIIADRGSIQASNGLPTQAFSFVSVLSGNDTITTGTGDDTILGGGNNDVIAAGAGNNYIVADDGLISFTAGSPVTSTLTPSATDGNDRIATLGGRDIVYTGDGDNNVLAGAGNDDVIGGSGIDLLVGETGDDFLVGMLGSDSIDGGEGHDVMFGGLPIGVRDDYQRNTSDFTLPPLYSSTEARYSSSLTSFGQPNISTGAYLPSILVTPAIVNGLSVDGVTQDGRDILLGGIGNDLLFGGSEEDELRGGLDADYLDAGAGNDNILEGDDGDDVVRGGSGNDLVRGGNGIDNLYGDDGEDILFGGAGTATGVQAGQRLFGGAGRDSLYAYAPDMANISQFNAQRILVGDQLFGGGDGDFVYGNARREVLGGDEGNDYIAGDLLLGPSNLPQLPGVPTSPEIQGADDILVGGSGEDQLYGGGGNDTIWGGAGSDLIDGQRGNDIQYGGAGIDLFTIRTDEPTATDTMDGHFGNAAAGDVADDNATDIVMATGTTGSDTILIGGNTTNSRQAIVRFNTSSIAVNMRSNTGNLLVEQFRIAGLAGNDTVGFYTLSAVQAGIIAANTIPVGFGVLDTTSLGERSRDYVGVFDGNSGNDTLIGSAGRDQLDGGLGSDSLYGFAGDDRLWGDTGNGSTVDNDRLFGGAGNDDLVGGKGTNSLFAWSFEPKINAADPFGVFVDNQGNLFNNDGNGARFPENTGLNRLLGSERNDELFGGTGVDFMYGNGGNDVLYRSNGTTFESLDEGQAGDEWKEFAQSGIRSSLVCRWYQRRRQDRRQLRNRTRLAHRSSFDHSAYQQQRQLHFRGPNTARLRRHRLRWKTSLGSRPIEVPR